MFVCNWSLKMVDSLVRYICSKSSSSLQVQIFPFFKSGTIDCCRFHHQPCGWMVDYGHRVNRRHCHRSSRSNLLLLPQKEIGRRNSGRDSVLRRRLNSSSFTDGSIVINNPLITINITRISAFFYLTQKVMCDVSYVNVLTFFISYSPDRELSTIGFSEEVC